MQEVCSEIQNLEQLSSVALSNSYASFMLSSLGPRREMLEKKISKSITQKRNSYLQSDSNAGCKEYKKKH